MANNNMVTNPSFETNTTSWSFTNSTGARDTAPNVTAGTGLYSCKVTSTGGVTSASYSMTGLTVGVNYTVSFYFKTQAVTTDFSVVPAVNGVYVSSKPQRSGTGFVRRFYGFTATSTTMTLSIQSETALTSGDAFWIDRIALNAGLMLPYFDGSYPFSSWTGTAHASTSVNTAFADNTVGTQNTDEVVVVNGLCLNNLAWNITSKTGRYTVSANRGDDLTIPGINGKIFVPNKPIDAGLYSLSMFIIGAYPDGTIPLSPAMRATLSSNLDQILSQCYSTSSTVVIYSWQPSGAVRMATATMTGSSAPDVNMSMGGRRAELTLVFEVLSGVWADAQSSTVTGLAGTGWSNQTLSLAALTGGTANIDDAVVTVTGPITNPTISNSITGTSVTYTGNVPAGQTWVMDSGQWASTVNGVSVLANTTHIGHPRFLVIDEGATITTAPFVTLTGTGTSSATNISVTAFRKHLTS